MSSIWKSVAGLALTAALSAPASAQGVVTEKNVSLAPAPDTLFELLSFITGGAQREKARALAQGEDPDGDAATLDVMAALQKFSGVRPHPEAFVEALEPLQPRL